MKTEAKIDLSRIRRNTGWSNNVKGAWVVLNDDGTVHADGFATYSDAKVHLALCIFQER